MLRRGQKGGDVRRLQEQLNGHGAALRLDGDFGPKTDRAVRQFQRSQGLQVDGIVGPKTQAALDGVSAGHGGRQSNARQQEGTRQTADQGNQPTNVQVPQRNLAGLDGAFRGKVVSILQELAGKGWQPVVAEGLRTRAQQAEKVRRGFSKTMNSRHLTGHAADIIDRRYGWGGPAARIDYAFWTDLGVAARRQGLEWGGDWRTFKDVAHVQVPR